MVQKSNEAETSADSIPVKVARLSSALAGSSTICFAIFDQDLRFRAVNQVVASTHGIAVEDHIGIYMDAINGEVAMQAAPALQQVLRSGHEVYAETVGKLPNRAYIGSWANHFFPIEVSSGKVQQVGVLAVEVTDLSKLDELYANLTGQLLHRATANELAVLRELHSCIGNYKAALGVNLASICNFTCSPEKTVELFTESLRLLDQRIEALSSAISSCFPLEREH